MQVKKSGCFFWTQCKPTCQLRLYCPMWLNRNYTFWQTSTTLITIKIIIIIIIIRNPPAFLAVMAKRPDGLTLIPWQRRQTLTWDATVATTLPDSYIQASASSAGAAAEMAASRKQSKYTAPPGSYLFQPTALETLGPINESAVQFLNNLGLKNRFNLCWG